MIWSALVGFGLWLLRLITGKSRSTEEKLGMEEAANVELRAGQDAIRKADEAAKRVEQEAASETYDPNDRADPRNAGRGL